MVVTSKFLRRSAVSWSLVGLFTLGWHPAAYAGDPMSADQARAAFAQGNYLAAANAFEAIYASGKEPKYRYNAGVARKRAGQLPEAIFHFSAYLALGGRISKADATDAEQRIGESIPGTTSVAVTVAPAEALAQATISIQAAGGTRLEAPLKAFLDQQGVQPGAYLLYLDARQWHVEVSAPGYQPAVASLAVGADGSARMISLSLKPEATPIAVGVGPQAAIDAGVNLTFTDGQGQVTEQTGAQAQQTQQLPPGNYTVRVAAPGFRTVERPLIVGRQPHNLNISLVPDPNAVAAGPAPAPEPAPPAEAVPSLAESEGHKNRAHRAMAIAYGITGAGLAGATVGLAVVGHNQFVNTTNQNDAAIAGAGITNPAELDVLSDPQATSQFDAVEAAYPKSALASDMGRALSLQYAAAGTAGASVGMLITSITAAKAKRPVAWKAELGIGAVLTAAGAVWFGVQNQMYQNKLAAAGPEAVRYDAFRLQPAVTQQYRASGLASAIILGVGSSLTVDSGIGLIVDRKKSGQRAQVSPVVGPSQAGVSISGRF